ncbi:MAG: hypothetical protein ACYDCF_11575, partial [Burkholderiales bacterium]
MYGHLPVDFKQWDMAEKDGWTVAHIAAEYGHLPADFKQWAMTNNRGWTVAHVAANKGPLPADFKQWDMVNKNGITVAQTAAANGHLPADESEHRAEPEQIAQAVASTMDHDLLKQLRERASIRDGSHPNWSGLSDSVANAQEFVRQHAMRNPELAEKWAADLRGNPFEYGQALGLESDNIRGIATLMEESVKRARHPVIGDLVRFDPHDQNPLKGSVFSGRVIAALDTGGGDVRYHLRAETGPDQGMEGTVYGKNGSFRLIHLIQAHGFERNAESVAPKVSRGDYVRYRDETGAEREGVVLDTAQPGEATRLRGIYRWCGAGRC